MRSTTPLGAAHISACARSILDRLREQGWRGGCERRPKQWATSTASICCRQPVSLPTTRLPISVSASRNRRSAPSIATPTAVPRQVPARPLTTRSRSTIFAGVSRLHDGIAGHCLVRRLNDITACQIYPSTTYINGTFQQASGGSDVWRCSSLTQSSAGLIPIPQSGTPSSMAAPVGPVDRPLHPRSEMARLRVVFLSVHPHDRFGEPWRGRITYSGSDISSAATTAVNNFLGAASTSNFTQDNVNLTVAYSGPPTDFTFRRMILHYANLCVITGGVDLFLLGSELRGIKTIRRPRVDQSGRRPAVMARSPGITHSSPDLMQLS